MSFLPKRTLITTNSGTENPGSSTLSCSQNLKANIKFVNTPTKARYVFALRLSPSLCGWGTPSTWVLVGLLFPWEADWYQQTLAIIGVQPWRTTTATSSNKTETELNCFQQRGRDELCWDPLGRYRRPIRWLWTSQTFWWWTKGWGGMQLVIVSDGQIRRQKMRPRRNTNKYALSSSLTKASSKELSDKFVQRQTLSQIDWRDAISWCHSLHTSHLSFECGCACFFTQRQQGSEQAAR